MTSQLDTNLILLYKDMVGLNKIINDTYYNSYLLESISINSNLSIGNQALFTNALSINSNLLISGSTFFNMPMAVSGFLNIYALNINGSTTVNSNLNIANININNNLNINNNSIINGISTYNSQLNIPGNGYFQNKIFVDNISNNNYINLNASQITIGTQNSNIYINGTSVTITNINSFIDDKLIRLNVNSTLNQGVDIGTLCGIEIMGISSTGFIKTSDDASRFVLKTPSIYSPTNYITIQDLNNNLIISGTTKLLNNTNIISSLNISGVSLFTSSVTINSFLNIGSNNIINSTCYINGALNINSNTIINNDCSINSFLNIGGFTNINNNTNINSSLNISGKTIINGQITINNSLYLNGTININNSTSINSKLNISGTAIFNNSISLNSFFNLSNNNFGSKTINTNLVVSGFSILNNLNNNSSLSISSISLLNQVTINSNVNISGQIMNNLLNNNFKNNTDAKNAGIPIWGFYRTGGALKIRLNDIPPTIYISGLTSIYIYLGSTFSDPGAYSLDFQNNNDVIYMTSIASGNSNLLNNYLLISGISTLITLTSTLPIGSYTATYNAADSCGNIGYNYRILNIYNNNIPILYNSTNIITAYNNPLIFTNNNMYDPQTIIQNVIWTLSSSSLTTNNFNYTQSWTLIMSMSLPTNPYIYFSFDSSQTGWQTSGINGYGTSNYEVAFDFRNSGSVIINANSRGQGVNWTGLNNNYITGNFTINNYINSNFYLIITYNNISNSININFITPNGINFLSWPSVVGVSGGAPMQFVNNKCPVAIFHESNTVANYYNGILLNNHSSIITYTDYKNLFNV